MSLSTYQQEMLTKVLALPAEDREITMVAMLAGMAESIAYMQGQVEALQYKLNVKSWKDVAINLKNAGLNNSEIARELGKSRGAVSTWLNSPEAMERLTA